jgi:hypothetical protein
MSSRLSQKSEAVSKVCHPALDAGSPEKSILIIRGIPHQVRDDKTRKEAFKTASLEMTVSQDRHHTTCYQDFTVIRVKVGKTGFFAQYRKIIRYFLSV